MLNKQSDTTVLNNMPFPVVWPKKSRLEPWMTYLKFKVNLIPLTLICQELLAFRQKKLLVLKFKLIYFTMLLKKEAKNQKSSAELEHKQMV